MKQNDLLKGGFWRYKRGINRIINLVLVALFLSTTITPAFSQTRTVSGKITDANGEGLIGVNILVKGTLNGTATDLDGNYAMSVSEDDVLVITYIGFTTQEVTVGSKTVIDITLLEDYGELDEVVVIGYGTTRKSDLTGAVTAIDTKDFNKGQMNNPQDLLVGRIAGVSVISNDGAPGGGSTIRIRGGSSLTASNEPLIVVDGVPLTTDEIGGLRNPLSTINPQDIANITVLKDASAAAIYGARASNGVIIVTTKRGTSGSDISVAYNTQFSLSVLPEQVDMMSAGEFTSFVQEQVAAGNVNSGAADQLGTSNTNWQDEIFQDGFGTTHDISATGSFENIPFRLSAGYLNQEGVVRTDEFERTSFSLGLDPTFLNDNLKASFNFKGSITDNRFANTGSIGAAIEFDPTQPVTVSDSPWGGYFFYPNQNDPAIPDNNAPDNPVALLEQTNNSATVDRITSNLKLTYEFPSIDGLSLTVNGAIDRINTDGLEVVDSLAASEFTTETLEGDDSPTELFGKRNKYDEEYRSELIEIYGNLARDIPSISSSFNFTGGYSFQDFSRELRSEISDVNQRRFTEDNVRSAPNRLISFYGRLQWNVSEKYLLTASVRRDGSSRFGEDNRWGTFPSVAFAWRLSDENFLKDIKPLYSLKLRAGWGVTAQENIVPDTNNPSRSAFPAEPTLNRSRDNTLYQIGTDENGEPIFTNLVRFEPFDRSLKWEETTTLNFGLDFAFFDGRINGTVDWYQRETEDLLNNEPAANGTNFSNVILTNVGNMENEGLEFTISGIVLDKSDWYLDLGYNVTFNRNEITKLTANDNPDFVGNPTGGVSGGTGNNAQINSVGNPRNSFYLYRQVFGEDGNPIEGVYVDVNGDGIINSDDLVVYESADPNTFMGFTGNLGYKNIGLGFNARMQLDNYVYNNVDSNYGWIDGAFQNNTTRNRIANATDNNFINNQVLSDIYLENGSFFRMDNIYVNYRVNRFFSDKFSALVSFTVQNAFIITDYTGLDPEIPEGIDNNLYPRPRVYTLGLNFNFN